MFAVYAESFSNDDPLSGLVVGERPEPREVPDGWTTIEVKAASLNHHDLFSLRGVGLKQEQLPMILGTDAAGLDEDGNEVVVHGVISGPGGRATRPSTRSGRCSPSATRVRWPSGSPSRVATSCPSRASLSFAEAACLPTAWLTAYRMLFTRGELRPGETVLVQGAGGGVATAAIVLGRAAGLRVLVTSRDEAKRAKALEIGAHEAFESGARLPGEGRRGDRDRREGDLVALDPLAAAGRADHHLRHDVGARPRRRRADPDLLPAAVGDRLDDGHPRRAGRAGHDARRHRRPPADRPRAADGPGARRVRGDGRGRRLRQGRVHRADGHPPAHRRRLRASARSSPSGCSSAATTLVLLARSTERAHDLRADLPDATVLVADLADAAAVEAVADQLPDSLDSVVHAAGVVDLGPVAAADHRGLAVAARGQPGRARPCSPGSACPPLRAARGTVVFVNSGAGPGRRTRTGRRTPPRSTACARWPTRCAPRSRSTASASPRSTPAAPPPPMQQKVHEQEGKEYDAVRLDRPGHRRRRDPARARPARRRDGQRPDDPAAVAAAAAGRSRAVKSGVGPAVIGVVGEEGVVVGQAQLVAEPDPHPRRAGRAGCRGIRRVTTSERVVDLVAQPRHAHPLAVDLLQCPCRRHWPCSASMTNLEVSPGVWRSQ